MIRPRRSLIGLAPVLAAAALLIPPVAADAANQRWFINGVVAETQHSGVIDWGTLSVENHFLGKLQCTTVSSGAVWNEGETGFGATALTTIGACTSEPTPCEGAFLAAEGPLELIKGAPKRGKSSLPWQEEVFREESGEKLRHVKIKEVKLTLVMPCLNLELPFEGTLEPIYRDGDRNGLSPSRLVFQGKGGTTSFLTTKALGTGEEENALHFVGEVAQDGTSVQLITAE